MKHTAIVAVVVIAGAALAALWRMSAPTPVDSFDAVPAGAPQTSERGATTGPDPAPPAPSAVALRQRIDDLELALQRAIDLRQAAETAFESTERDVAELEAFVDEIESRGEDPVDYADEGLEKFQRVFVRYETSLAALEEAEALEQAARDELAVARRALADTAKDASR